MYDAGSNVKKKQSLTLLQKMLLAQRKHRNSRELAFKVESGAVGWGDMVMVWFGVGYIQFSKVRARRQTMTPGV